MLKKSKFAITACISILMVIGMLLSACGEAAVVEPKPTATNLPVVPTYTPYAEAEEEAAAEEVEETEEEVAETANVNAWGVVLPDDAAPVDQQHITIMGAEGVTTDFFVSVYKRGNSMDDMLTTPFVRLNKNFELVKAGAVDWTQSEDGTVWTFYMDPNLTWSDGNPVTADDVVFSFQYGADPVHAWDFTWFWGDIVNWNEAVAGEVALEEIGVKKVDTYTVEFHLTAPAPYFLAKALYIRPLSKVAFEAHGEYYNTNPETSVSSTPWILTEWVKGSHMSWGPNLNYTGDLKPYLESFTMIFGDTTTEFSAYRAGEVDMAGAFTPADIQLIQSDPELSKEYHAGFGDFRTYYLGFNTYAEPFDDILVRKAFSMAIDRNAIIENVIGVQGRAAYSFLMPGFPASDAETYKTFEVNQYDPEAAAAYLAEAGYPGGEGFPAQELWLRDENDLNQAVGAAIASMITQNLGIPVEVSNKENKLFMEELNAHRLPLYMVSYGFDYLDPSNMLGIWTSTGRHAWLNEEFDQLIADASAFTGDPNERTQMFMDAEKIMVEDVPAAFIYHATPGYIYHDYFKGVELEPDKVGVATMHWPTFESVGMLMPTIYIGENVSDYR